MMLIFNFHFIPSYLHLINLKAHYHLKNIVFKTNPYSIDKIISYLFMKYQLNFNIKSIIPINPIV